MGDINSSFGFSHNPLPDNHFDNSYWQLPDATVADYGFLENQIAPVTNSFNTEYDNLAYNNPDTAFDISDFCNDITEPPQSTQPEIQLEDGFTSQTASLQPPVRASFNGCDDGRHAAITV